MRLRSLVGMVGETHARGGLEVRQGLRGSQWRFCTDCNGDGKTVKGAIGVVGVERVKVGIWRALLAMENARQVRNGRERLFRFPI